MSGGVLRAKGFWLEAAGVRVKRTLCGVSACLLRPDEGRKAVPQTDQKAILCDAVGTACDPERVDGERTHKMPSGFSRKGEAKQCAAQPTEKSLNSLTKQ